MIIQFTNCCYLNFCPHTDDLIIIINNFFSETLVGLWLTGEIMKLPCIILGNHKDG